MKILDGADLQQTRITNLADATVASDAVNLRTLQAHVTASVQRYEHAQPFASPTWTIVHELNEKYVEVSCFEADDSQIEGSVTFIDNDSCQVDFLIPVAGIAIVRL